MFCSFDYIFVIIFCITDFWEGFNGCFFLVCVFFIYYIREEGKLEVKVNLGKRSLLLDFDINFLDDFVVELVLFCDIRRLIVGNKVSGRIMFVRIYVYYKVGIMYKNLYLRVFVFMRVCIYMYIYIEFL